MTAALDCPKCGAPLRFDPHPGDETLECPYCHGTVIIPEDLRIPEPRAAAVRQPPAPSRPSSKTGWVFFAIVAGLFATVMIIANLSSQPTSDSLTDTSTYDPGADLPASDPTAVEDPTATFEAAATGEALQSLLKTEQNWPAGFGDAFADNTHKWRTGDVRDSYISGNRSIANGIYVWKITSVKSAFDYSFPDTPDGQDFYASVDMKLVSMPDDPDADAGLVFRYNSDDQTWYYFSVNNEGQYYFGWYDGTSWSTLIPETGSDAIHIGQVNRLSVGAQGSQFIFVVNGRMVDHFIDDNLASGNTGLGINLPEADEKASIEFSNFSVQSISPKP